MELKELLEELQRIGERIKQAESTILPLLRNFGFIRAIIFCHTTVPTELGKTYGPGISIVEATAR